MTDGVDDNNMAQGGETVTFTVDANDGYLFDGVTVTYTDGTTGTVAVTDNGDGTYSFIMPDAAVTVTASFNEVDLYLLGTAMGRTTWVPAGPRFNYDATTDEYYLDVYFKGTNADSSAEGYGYFSLAQSIDTSIDWTDNSVTSGDWSQVTDRLAAEWSNKEVDDGSTETLYDDRQDNAFKIPAGIYRIIVNSDKTSMSIVEIPVTLTITPESGTTQEAGTVVNITSDVESKVHAIADTYGINEDSQTIQYSLNSSALTVGDQLTLTNPGENTVYGQSTIGYIMATNTATYNVQGSLYLVGWHNGVTTFQMNGTPMTYDADSGYYYIDVYYKGIRQNYDYTDGDVTKGWFHFSTIQDNTGDDDDTRSHFLIADYNDFPVTSYDEGGTAVNHNLHAWTSGSGTTNAFEINPGVYTIYVSADKSTMWVEKHPLTLTFDPVSGSTVAANTTVTASSDLQTIVQAINANEVAQQFRNTTDGGTNWEYDNTAVITEVGTTTVNAAAWIGYIEVSDTAYYIIEPTAYGITYVVSPEGAGTVSGATTSTAGETITVYTTTNDGYAINNVVVTIDGTSTTVDVTDNDDGTYSFIMPEGNVTVTANYDEYFDITTQCTPAGGGSIILTDETTQALGGDEVTFTVTTNEGYSLNGMTLTYVDENNVTQTVTLTPDGDGNYSFTMPDADVTIVADFTQTPYGITTECNPSNGGSINDAGASAYADSTVDFTVTANNGYTVHSVTVTNETTGDVTTLTPDDDGNYSFVMPASAVTITANFASPLNVIENTGIEEQTYIVADELIGTWAVDNGTTHLLWAKDQGNISIDQTTPTTDQEDYMRTILGLQVDDWDQSNWVILDMSTLCEANSSTAATFVNKKITAGSIKGTYKDDVNYKIQVIEALPTTSGDATGYDGYIPDPDETGGKHPTDADYAQDTHYLYNQYCTGNFLLANLNSPYGNGYSTSDGSRKVFFMNPKVMEVAHIHAAMWNGASFEAPAQSGTDVNGLNINGAFDVDWTYNRLTLAGDFGPAELTTGNIYSFHVAVMLKSTATNNHKRGVPRQQGTPDGEFMVYPLDMYNNQIPTAVVEIVNGKVVESVRYYNIMGQESLTPFDGINIEVVRYSDGSSTSRKVLR